MLYDVSGLAEGTPLELRAIVRDRSGDLNADTVTAVVGEVARRRQSRARRATTRSCTTTGRTATTTAGACTCGATSTSRT